LQQHNNAQRGSALITALMIVAIVASLATIMLVREQSAIHTTELAQNVDRETIALNAARLWAKHILQQPTLQKMPRLMPATQLGSMRLHATLIDAQGLFNINSLQSAHQQPAFRRLLLALVPNLTTTQSTTISQAVHNWLLPTANNAYYLQLTPPYRAAGQLMVSSSELRLVQGISALLWQHIAAFIVALPTSRNQININDAPAAVLMTLGTITRAQAGALIACRHDNGRYRQTAPFLACASRLGVRINHAAITTHSQYFILQTTVQTPQQHMRSTALFRREKSRGKIIVWILW